jgi:hypothetical protein
MVTFEKKNTVTFDSAAAELRMLKRKALSQQRKANRKKQKIKAIRLFRRSKNVKDFFSIWRTVRLNEEMRRKGL